MRRWAMVSTLRQIGTRRPNRRRMMRSISASVGKGWQQRFCQRCGAGLRPALLTGNACRKASGSWCSATARSDPDQWPLGAPNRCHSSPDAVEFPIRERFAADVPCGLSGARSACSGSLCALSNRQRSHFFLRFGNHPAALTDRCRPSPALHLLFRSLPC
jgi:hypothetical protein